MDLLIPLYKASRAPRLIINPSVRDLKQKHGVSSPFLLYIIGTVLGKDPYYYFGGKYEGK